MRDNLTERAARLGQILRKGLEDLQVKHPVIGDIRGRGLLQGIEIVAPEGCALGGAEMGVKIADRAMELGLSCNVVNLASFSGVFRIAPPLTVSEEELAKGLQLLDQSFTEILSQL